MKRENYFLEVNNRASLFYFLLNLVLFHNLHRCKGGELYITWFTRLRDKCGKTRSITNNLVGRWHISYFWRET